jgi:DNA-binding MarR family transcriptional regulator
MQPSAMLLVMASPTEEITQCLVDLMRRHHLYRIHAHMTEKAGVPLVERGGLPVVGFIKHHGPVSSSDVAEALGIDGSTVSRHVSRLEQAGLLSRSPDPNDARVSLLQVTEAGQEVFRRMHQARRQMLEEVLAGWSKQDMKRFAADLRRLADDFNAYLEGL